MNKTVLGIFAHPDDAEFLCAGTLRHLFNKGWNIHIATLAPGDKGTAEHTREEISRIRTAEASRAVEILKGTYHCLDYEDVYIMYDRDSVNRTTSLIRKVKPDLVLTHSPDCYMVDHETCSRIVQTACFSVGIKNLEIDDPPGDHIPFLYYSDAMEGKNHFGETLPMAIKVDISAVIMTKENMLACHESQRSWLMSYHNMDEYIISMKSASGIRGKEIGVEYAEGFNQHLGHGFPQNNILYEVLGNLVYAGSKT
jgi:LmbE family N-acetylglucosaminyl deacetylase